MNKPTVSEDQINQIEWRINCNILGLALCLFALPRVLESISLRWPQLQRIEVFGDLAIIAFAFFAAVAVAVARTKHLRWQVSFMTRHLFFYWIGILSLFLSALSLFLEI